MPGVMRTSRPVIAVFLLITVCTCGPVGGVASFWKSYRSEFIVAQQSDQGPWGGWRWIQWRAELPGTFKEGDVRAFADRKGWKCVQRDEYSAETVASWTASEHQPIFSSSYPMNRDFPRR